MSHDLCLYSQIEEFDLVGCPDAEATGLGRSLVFGGNAGSVVDWYEEYCRSLTWDQDDWVMAAGLAPSCVVDHNDHYSPPPEWAKPDAVTRHIAMVDAFLAFAPGAKFGAS